MKELLEKINQLKEKDRILSIKVENRAIKERTTT